MFVGIDVSKNTLEVALLKAPGKARHKVFSNSVAGHQQLLCWLQEQEQGVVVAHACLEATGTWAAAVALTLHQAGHQVSVVNPALIRAFGQSHLKRTKTDKADAQLSAHFCQMRQMHQPPLWTPPAPELRELQALVRRLESLEEMRVMEENRLSSGVNCAAVRADLQEHLADLQKRIDKTRGQIKDHINQNPGLQQQAQLLQTPHHPRHWASYSGFIVGGVG